MKRKSKSETALEALRQHAEQVMLQGVIATPDGDKIEWLRLLKKIEVYQIELELQNQELSQSAKELEAARYHYFELYESAPVAYVTLDSKGLIERMNQATAHMAIPSVILLEGSFFARAVHPDDTAAFFVYLNRMVTDKERSSCEVRLCGNDERPLWMQVIATCRFDSQKHFRGWRLVLVDITERKQQALAMQKAQGDLARLSKELTIAEQRERRRLAEMMHDHLQQLLAGAKLNLEMVLDETAAEHQQAFKKAYELIVQALLTSRSLSVELSPPVLFLQGLPETMRWLARWMKKTHALDVEMQVDEGDYPIEEAIKVLLFQSVRELLFNIKKHSLTHCAQVTMTRQDAMVKVVIKDSGPGFDPQILWQNDIPSDKGFGLFSVRERLVLSEGTFDIVSSPDGGTTVALTAPMHLGGAAMNAAVGQAIAIQQVGK
jgi:PAS domain S-box-containing protein